MKDNSNCTLLIRRHYIKLMVHQHFSTPATTLFVLVLGEYIVIDRLEIFPFSLWVIMPNLVCPHQKELACRYQAVHIIPRFNHICADVIIFLGVQLRNTYCTR